MILKSLLLLVKGTSSNCTEAYYRFVVYFNTIYSNDPNVFHSFPFLSYSVFTDDVSVDGDDKDKKKDKKKKKGMIY